MPCVDGKNLVWSLKELNQIYEFNDGDDLAVIPDGTDGGVQRIKYKNMLFNKDETTFGTTIDNHTTSIDDLKTTIASLSTQIQFIVDEYRTPTKAHITSIGADVDEVTYTSDNIKSITKTLNDEGQTIYTATYNNEVSEKASINANPVTIAGAMVVLATIASNKDSFVFRMLNVHDKSDALNVNKDLVVDVEQPIPDPHIVGYDVEKNIVYLSDGSTDVYDPDKPQYDPANDEGYEGNEPGCGCGTEGKYNQYVWRYLPPGSY